MARRDQPPQHPLFQQLEFPRLGGCTLSNGNPEIWSAIRRNPAKGLGWCQRRVRLLRLLGWVPEHMKKTLVRHAHFGHCSTSCVCMRFQEAHSTSFDHRFLGIERIEKVQGETSSLVRAPLLCRAGWRSLEKSNTVGNCNFAHPRIAKAPRRG